MLEFYLPNSYEPSLQKKKKKRSGGVHGVLQLWEVRPMLVKWTDG